MTCTYGGIPCLDPAQELANCRALGYPTPWAGVANSFTCPQGQEPGRGRVLMLRGDLLSLNLNTFYPLVFSDGTRSVTLKQVLFVRAYCATPGGRGDPTEAYWCELADKRLLCHQPIDRGYNVRSAPGGAYYSATLNSGTPWTWAQMVADIWFTVNKLGATFPGLPFTPDGTPEGWSFWGSDVFDALGAVLDRLGCALDYNPVTDTFSIVRLGVADVVEAAALGAVDAACVWDSDPLEGVKARVPAVVRVFFPNQRDAADTTGGSPFTFRDVTDPTPGGPLVGADPNNVTLVYDDLPAIYTAGSLTNSAALTTRATERGADFFRRVRQTRLYRGYTGGYGATGLLPGAQLTATLWRDTGGGLFTEVVRLPGPLAGDPFAGLPGAGPGGGAGAEGAPGAPGTAGGAGEAGIPGAPGGVGLYIVPYPYRTTYQTPYQSPYPYGINYLYQLLYPSFAVSLPAVEVKNVDNTQDTPTCAVFRANNDLSTGLLKWTADAPQTGYISWMGLQLYKAGFGQVGPETVLEIQDDGGVTGVVSTISDDAASGRVVLKYSWKGLTLAAAGTNYGPEPKLEVIAGTGIALTAADDAAGGQTQITITNDDPADHKVYVSGTDTTPDFLKPKLVAGTGITITQNNVGANETLTFAATGTGGGGAGTATNYTPTTTDTLVDVFDLLSSNGLIGGVSLRNSGATHTLTYQIRVKDMFGNTGTTTAANLSPGSATNWSLLSAVGLSGVFFPYQEFALSLKSSTTGQSTTASVWVVVAN